ncbi:TatD family hydrolase [Kineothrix sp. MSJ-39]|uniref:TatD family hydrolase n=1 Tax=Kineothrix sp. MSJ-39 TaxID=2841533 RepID=UPI001C114B9E|nr:TatD family hydrolase [Kineothrix sp. MSJ-39]MBU5429047.1 TatD family hydrolase [Kineothrix sp. MSJ-39]
MIIDSHAHYDDEAFEEDRDSLLQFMQDNGIEKIINVGANIKGSRASIALSEQYSFIYAAVGVHPSDTEELDEEKMAWLKEVSAKKKVVAIGEIGLDYYWPEPDREIQKKWFIKQMELAQEVNLPVIIHSRDAAQDTIEILRQFPANGVIHCYSYTKESAKEFLKMGYYFGIGGVLTFKNAKKLKEAVMEIPMERILLETDSPYLAPEPNRGKRNSSLNIPYVVKELAQLKGISEEEVVNIATENTKKLFHLI